jgi:tetratricopeptide (TPR) repeat protein
VSFSAADMDLAFRLAAQGRLDEAEVWSKKILDSNDDPRAVYLLAAIAAQRGRLPESFALFERAAELLPGDASLAYNFGVVCQQAGHLERAAAEWHRALEIDPRNGQALYNLSKALADLGRVPEAISAYEALLALDPSQAPARFNLANILFRAADYAAAAGHFRCLVADNPAHVDGWINLGMTERRLDDLDAAETAYRRALALAPARADAHWNLSHVLLSRGRWAEGFAEFESRLALPAMRPPAWATPAWIGAADSGKRIAFHAEQGVGDAIHFLRYVRFAATRGIEPHVVCHRPLVRLAASAPGVAAAHAFDDALPHFDGAAPLLSLPFRLGLSEPAETWMGPYLSAPEVLPVPLDGPGMRVGLVWSGNKDYERNDARSCPPQFLAPLATIPGVSLFSLQVGAAASEFASFADGAVDLAPHLVDYATTAAIIARLDAVVSVCTSVAHLTGALGKPLLLMLGHHADWRWGLSGETTAWYPSARLFRQERPGDWPGVVAKVARALAGLAARDRARP